MSVGQIQPKENNNVNEDKNVACRFCKSTNTMKKGYRTTMNRGKIQRYICKECDRSFTKDEGFLRMRNSESKITSAIDLYFSNLSSRKVRNYFRRHLEHNSSHVTVLDWCRRYVLKVQKYVNTLSPQLSGKVYADETEIDRGKNNDIFWCSVDWDTRYINATLYSPNPQNVPDAIIISETSNYKNDVKKEGTIEEISLIDDELPYLIRFNDGKINQYSAEDLKLNCPEETTQERKDVAAEKIKIKQQHTKQTLEKIVAETNQEINAQQEKTKQEIRKIIGELKNNHVTEPITHMIFNYSLPESKPYLPKIEPSAVDEINSLGQQINYQQKANTIAERIQRERKQIIKTPRINTLQEYNTFKNTLADILVETPTIIEEKCVNQGDLAVIVENNCEIPKGTIVLLRQYCCGRAYVETLDGHGAVHVDRTAIKYIEPAEGKRAEIVNEKENQEKLEEKTRIKQYTDNLVQQFGLETDFEKITEKRERLLTETIFQLATIGMPANEIQDMLIKNIEYKKDFHAIINAVIWINANFAIKSL